MQAIVPNAIAQVVNVASYGPIGENGAQLVFFV